MSALGYFDLQVNGYLGVDFNGETLEDDHVAKVCRQLARSGVAGILATIITDRLDRMTARIRRVVELCRQNEDVGKLIQGIHLEGPFLNPAPGFIGAHPADCALPASSEAIEPLLEAGAGMVRIVTLAPECDERMSVTRMLSQQGIVVSAGHCDPSWQQLRDAIEAGLTMFTHLGNGCPLMLHRHDNIIQRALSLSERLWIGLIADGVHVPMMTLKNILRCATIDRCFVVSDAIAAAGMGPGTYRLGDQTVLVDEHLATWAPDKSHLVGSAITLQRAGQNLREQLQLSERDIEKLLAVNPRRAIGVL